MKEEDRFWVQQVRTPFLWVEVFLTQVHKQGALQVPSGYRTVSEPTAMVIVVVIPLAFLAKGSKAI